VASAPEAPSGVQLIYVNWVGAQPGPFDLSIDVGYQGPPGPPQPIARMVMTWEHAKLLRDVMDALIEQREKNTGEIGLPEGVALVKPTDDPSATDDKEG
jgi:hypothetical protein